MTRSNAVTTQLVILGALGLACAPPVHASPEATLIARTGDPLPTVVGGEILGVAAPSVSTSDAVALGIVSTLDARTAILRRLQGMAVFEPVAWTGRELPTLDGAFDALVFPLFTSVFVPPRNLFVSVGPEGDVALLALVSDSASPSGPARLGGYAAPAMGAIEQVWRSLDPFPEIEGIPVVGSGGIPTVADDGAYLGTVFGSPGQSFAIRQDQSGVSVILDANDPRAGFGFDSASEHAWNGRGDFVATSGATVILAENDGAVSLLTPGDDATPGVPGSRFRETLGVSLADDGTVAFTAEITRTSTLMSNGNNSIWVSRDGGLSPLAVSGGDAPDGRLFRQFGNAVVGAGDAFMFNATQRLPDGGMLSGDAPALFLASRPDSILRIAEQGMPAPGAGDAPFLAFDEHSFAINERGDAAFRATLSFTPNDSDNGLWVWDNSAEELVLIARTGDLVDASRQGEAPDMRTILNIRFCADDGLAANGNMGYTLQFTDGTSAAFTTRIGVETPACTADLDADSDVDMGDFGMFASAFNSTQGDDAYLPEADFNTDGDVDLGDFGTFGAQFGRTDCDS